MEKLGSDDYTPFETLSDAEKAILGQCRTAEEILGIALVLLEENFNDNQLIATIGEALRLLKDNSEHLANLKSVLPNDSVNTVAIGALGEIFFLAGDKDSAEDMFAKALDIDPLCGPTLNRFGQYKYARGESQEALVYLRDAAEIEPKNAYFQKTLGLVCERSGMVGEAVAHYYNAANYHPGEDSHRRLLVGAASKLSFESYDQDKETLMLKILAENLGFGRPRFLWAAISSLLHAKPSIASWSRRLEDDRQWNSLRALGSEILLIRCLTLFPLPDLKLEPLFIKARNQALEMVISKSAWDFDELVAITAISVQSHLNEYLYPESSEEMEQLMQLQKQLSAVIEAKGDLDPFAMIVLAAYRQLSDMPWAADFVAEYSEKFKGESWFEVHLVRSLQEKKIVDNIPSLSQIGNDTSRKVRAMYEESPYPRWEVSDFRGEKKLLNLFPQLGLPLPESREFNSASPRLLVAGCGTGQSLTEIAGDKNSQVLGLDLSKRSLAFAARKCMEYGLTNVEFMHADILNLGALARKFEVIDCSGVLHHMDEPGEALKILSHMVVRGGLIKIALYSKSARSVLQECRLRAQRLGIANTHEGRSKFRQHLIDDYQDFSATPLFRWGDFYSASEFRDLLFHVQEVDSTLLDVKRLIKEAGLVFRGFEPDAAHEINVQRARKEFGDQFDLLDLDAWSEFESRYPESFVGMYQVWLQRT